MSRFAEIADDIKGKIKSGQYRPGLPLPHQDLLALEYGASNQTIYHAIQVLKAEQLVIRSVTQGMIVQPPPIVVDLVLHGPHGNGPLPWAACCERSGAEGKMITGKVDTVEPSPDVADLLKLDSGDKVVIRNRQATISDNVARLDQAVYPHSAVADTPIAKRDQVPGGIYRALTDAGLEPYSIVRRVIGARMATNEEAKALKVVKRSLVLTYDQVIATREGQLVELLRFVANPTRIRFVDEDMSL
ncbi:GntR family transcriptional regulator [Nonomuraea maritima]|uniref:GntR family transcriptional regulator n=1 Tax=Nonomuraea maritima TaxID=683260 RepID=A0A1G9MRB6_9ACTN|nr:GntR family transcriptional regulator [Nonomuraea maritima]SDL76561.1 GntR family transcriptional regulator [Nonomuraea maritima]